MNLVRPLQVFLWSYVFLFAVVSSLSITQVDLWWQLSEGMRILHMWSLPTQPDVAYGLPAQPYFDEYAGYEVVLASLYHLTGFAGLWFVFAAVFLAILLLPVATTSRRLPAFDLLSTFAFLVAILLVRERLEQRPEIVGGLLQVVLMVLLRGSSLDKIGPRMPAALFALFVVWTNVHSTFVFGFFTLGLWVLSGLWTQSKSAPRTVLIRHGALVAAVAIAAAMLNPYGPRRLLFPFLQASDFGSTALSPEMWPITAFTTLVEYYLAIAVALMAWAMVRTRGLPPWLIAFAVFSVVISIKSFRFIDFVAISLLFVYAARDEQAEAKPFLRHWLLSLLPSVLLVIACLFFLLLDATMIVSNYAERRTELAPATRGLRYASDIAAYPVEAEDAESPVLCGHGMGSYLSFEGHGNFRPLLDSGLSHFSDDTKRYFFFTWLEPEGLAAALDRLHVDYVLLDFDTFPWIPTLHRLPDWQFVACTPNGMIWQRSRGAPHPLSDEDRAQITAAIAAQEKSGGLGVASAFAYSTLLDQPADSLDILSRYGGPPWTDSFVNSLGAWLSTIPQADLRDFLASGRARNCPLLGAMASAQVGTEAYDHFIASGPKDPGVWHWRAVRVQVLLQKGDRDGARKAFDSISPAPKSSTNYYQLWHQLYDGDAARAPLSAYGQWQTWDDAARKFMDDESARLNDRIAGLDRAAAN